MCFAVIHISDHPELIPLASHWFSQKFSVPMEAYKESMYDSTASSSGVPSWYVIMADEKIVAGLGVIENDFHQRKDLTPNICAVFVEPEYRKKGLARMLLNHACQELSTHGINTCYLTTDHTDFYEHCGWQFYQMIPENDGNLARCYRFDYKSTI